MPEQQLVFIPAAVWDRIVRKKESFAAMVTGPHGSMSIDGFNFIGHWVRMDTDIVEQMCDLFSLERKAIRLPVSTDPYVVLANDSDMVFVQINPVNLFAGHESVLQGIEKTLLDVGVWAGAVFYLYFSAAPCFTPLPPVKYGVNVVVGSAPAGEYGFSRSTHLCGVMLDARGREVSHPAPTSARGCVVTDEDGNHVAQIIGDTIYLLIPVRGLDSLRRLNGEGGNLFAGALRLAWNAFIGDKPEIKEKELDEAAYRAFISEGGTSLPVRAMAELGDVEKEIQSVLARYRELLNRKRELSAIATMSVLEDQDLLKNASADWQRLRERPEVESVKLVGLGIHIRTKRIISDEWEGNRYQFGTFVIRFGIDGRVSVWCEKPMHPKGIPHPHISAEGGICFGNVGPIIQEAAHERRYPDAADIIFNWLISGYDPERAIHKISEWPVMEQEKAS